MISTSKHLSTKFILVILAVFLVGTTLTSLFIWRKSVSASEEATLASISSQLRLLEASANSLRDDAVRSLKSALAGLAQLAPAPYTLNPKEEISVGGRNSPMLRAAGQALTGNHFACDQVSAIVGGVCSIFVRQGDDFVRVSSTVKKPDGSRAVGTPMDRNSGSYQAAVKGEEILSVNVVQGKAFIAIYQPIKDAQQNVIGVIAVGYDLTERIAAFKSHLAALKIGETGYFYILDASSGERRGTFVAHPSLEGKGTLGSKDSDGKLFFDEMLEKKNGVTHYRWVNAGEASPREKLAVYHHIASWNWIIAGGSYVEELTRTGKQVVYGLIAALVLQAVLMIAVIAWLFAHQVSRPLKSAQSVIAAIAEGNLSSQIDSNRSDEIGEILSAVESVQNAIRSLVADAALLSGAAVEGQLATRADVSKHQGDFRKIVQGVNDTLDSVIGPLNVAASYVDQISKGAIPAKISDSYNGDFNTLKNNLNVCIDAVNALVADANRLSKAAVEGKLETRADAAKHQGDFRKIVEGVNATLNSVIGPLNEGMRVFGALSQGDLTQKITDNYQGTFQKLKEDANLTVEKLTEIVTSIKEATESINVASKEIASGNTDLSSRTEQQASSLEETASSMEELTSTVKQNAENAKQANQLAAGASQVAVKGGEVVGQVVTTMSSINDSSKKIVDIISVIDGIAFQTNILALNAAVEAARAGEQGRGFAVVATEVRTLAQRSAAAAKEIKELIGDSVEKVGAGTKLVDEAGITMREIVSSVKRVTDIMAEITAASQEQSSGIEQVNTTITQMDEATQQNAALVEQAAAAAESMEVQSAKLGTAVGLFRLSQQAGHTVSARPGAARGKTEPAPRKVATIHHHPSARAGAAKTSAGGGDWAEF